MSASTTLPEPPPTILLLEDSRAIREIVKLFLGARYEFVEAENGPRALMLVQLTKPALVIADVNVPGLNGIEFLNKLKNDPSSRVRQIPVILLTGDKSEQVMLKARAEGAVGVLHKPVSGLVLNAAVENALVTAQFLSAP